MCVRVRVHILGCRQAVRHQTLTLAFVGSNPAIPAKYGSLAQLVEQRPFKAWVQGSSPWRATKNPHLLMEIGIFEWSAGTRKGRPGEAGEKQSGGLFLAPCESPSGFRTHPAKGCGRKPALGLHLHLHRRWQRVEKVIMSLRGPGGAVVTVGNARGAIPWKVAENPRKLSGKVRRLPRRPTASSQ